MYPFRTCTVLSSAFIAALPLSANRTVRRQPQRRSSSRIFAKQEYKPARVRKPNKFPPPPPTIFATDQQPSYEPLFPPGKLPLSLELDFVLNHPVTDASLAFLVLLNCLAFALQTVDTTPLLTQAFHAFERNLTIVFLIEYFGRWYGKGLSPRYLLTRGMIIDFLAIAPIGFAVADQSEALFVRALRLSRILRLQRMVMDSEGSKEMMESMTDVQARLASIGLSLFSLLYVSAGLFFQVEKEVNPAVQNFFDAFYFTTITLFTVGFGDVTPLTSFGRIITVLTVIIGAVIIPFQLSEVERVRQLSAKSTNIAGASVQVENGVRNTSSQEKASQTYNPFMPLYSLDIECHQCKLRGHQVDARFCRNCGCLLTKRRFDK